MTGNGRKGLLVEKLEADPEFQELARELQIDGSWSVMNLLAKDGGCGSGGDGGSGGSGSGGSSGSSCGDSSGSGSSP